MLSYGKSDHSPFKCREAVRVQKAGESRQRRVHRARLLKDQQKAMTHHQAALEAERALRIRSAVIVTPGLFFHSLTLSLTCSPSHSLARLFALSLAQPLTHALIHSLTQLHCRHCVPTTPLYVKLQCAYRVLTVAK